MSIQLPEDFKEFLKSLAKNDVHYLLVGGYAVGYYGYPRPTGDMDIWISNSAANSSRVVTALADFGISSKEISPELFAGQRSIVRMGVPPFKLEIITFIDGVEFDDCFERRVCGVLEGVQVDLISLSDLRKNKTASGRPKDLSDLENLPDST
jgi:hypothetical protein